MTVGMNVKELFDNFNREKELKKQVERQVEMQKNTLI